jgi:hypothetical protein
MAKTVGCEQVDKENMAELLDLRKEELSNEDLVELEKEP